MESKNVMLIYVFDYVFDYIFDYVFDYVFDLCFRFIISICNFDL